jgi:elongator complex protein 3
VFGHSVPIHAGPGKEWQHRGFGARLVEECERIAEEEGHDVLAVTSGVGVREYYRRHAREHGRPSTMAGPYVALPLR